MSPVRLSGVVLLALAASALPARDQAKPALAAEDGSVPLFNGKDLAGWVNVNCHPGTFFVKDGEIVTTGTPTGFLRSEKQYENFVLDFDWMHVEKEKMANSGLFVWGDPLPAVGTPYTRGIEVQVLINYAPKDGWATSHGDIFSIHGARCTPDRPHPSRKGMERCLPSENRVKGAGEWNHYKVIANDGALKLEVNGKEVSGVSKCTPRKGYLALESEGAECHFKNIRIKEMPSTNPKPEEVAKVAEGHVSIFNGLDLKGWKAGKDSWKVGGGIIKCVGNANLLPEKQFLKYELVFDWKMPPMSRGGFVVEPRPGLRMGLDAVEGFNSTDLRVRGAWLQVSEDRKLKQPLKPGTWSRATIAFDGKRLTCGVNGETQITSEAQRPGVPDAFTFFAFNGLEIMNVFVRELKEKK